MNSGKNEYLGILEKTNAMDKEALKEHYRKSSRVDFSLANADDPNAIIYKLFTKESPDEEVILTEDNVESRQLDKTCKTILLIHGWTSDDTSPWYGPLKQTYLQTGPHNIIYVNWSKYGDLTYPVSSANVEPVGRFIAEFLKKSKIPAKNIHLVGHSLGSQLSAFIGKAYDQRAGQKIGRITALDPAGPGWSNPDMKKEERLNKSDADFVDVIHTDIQIYGYANPCGHVDYYPNGGTDQPGCPDAEQKENCNHHRSTWIFMESIRTQVKAREINFREGEDHVIHITAKEDHKEVIFGEHVDLTARGVYYFETNPTKPYLKD